MVHHAKTLSCAQQLIAVLIYEQCHFIHGVREMVSVGEAGAKTGHGRYFNPPPE